MTVRVRETTVAPVSTPVASVKFEVGACYETFELNLNLQVSDAAGMADHEGSQVAVLVSPEPGSQAICHQAFTAMLEVDASGAASYTQTLARRPLGQGAEECNYSVEVPATALSPAGALRRTSAAARPVGGGTTEVVMTFEGVRPQTVSLVNATALNPPRVVAGQGDVVVTVTPAADCARPVLGETSHSVAAGAAAATGSLSVADCEWQLSAVNATGDCVVTVQLRGAGNAAVGSLVPGGGPVSVFVVGGQVRSAASGGELVEAAEFVVTSGCVRLFAGTVAVSVDVPADVAGDYAGTELTVNVAQRAPARAECGAGTAQVTLRLGAAVTDPADGQRSHTASGLARNLVAQPLGSGGSGGAVHLCGGVPPYCNHACGGGAGAPGCRSGGVQRVCAAGGSGV